MLIKKYLEEAIQLELNVSKLYILFSSLHDVDYDFWFNLSIEEGGHAAILKNILIAIDIIEYDFKIDEANLNELVLANDYITSLLIDDSFKRAETFAIAMDIENTAGELHYQQLIDSDVSDTIIKTFIKLNNDDEQHYIRIKEYATTNNIL